MICLRSAADSRASLFIMAVFRLLVSPPRTGPRAAVAELGPAHPARPGAWRQPRRRLSCHPAPGAHRTAPAPDHATWRPTPAGPGMSHRRAGARCGSLAGRYRHRTRTGSCATASLLPPATGESTPTPGVSGAKGVRVPLHPFLGPLASFSRDATRVSGPRCGWRGPGRAAAPSARSLPACRGETSPDNREADHFRYRVALPCVRR
jgi:hypothetical protein